MTEVTHPKDLLQSEWLSPLLSFMCLINHSSWSIQNKFNLSSVWQCPAYVRDFSSFFNLMKIIFPFWFFLTLTRVNGSEEIEEKEGEEEAEIKTRGRQECWTIVELECQKRGVYDISSMYICIKLSNSDNGKRNSMPVSSI